MRIHSSINDGGVNIKAEVIANVLKGDATLRTIHNHNTTVATMLIGIARFIRGDFTLFPTDSSIFIPKYLGVGYCLSAPTTEFNATSLTAELTNYVKRFEVARGDVSMNNASGEVAVQLRAIIPSSSFPAGTHINELGLFPSYTPGSTDMLARVTYVTELGAISTGTDENHLVVSSDESIEIVWKIVFSRP